jgi:hypothetical protein
VKQRFAFFLGTRLLVFAVATTSLAIDDTLACADCVDIIFKNNIYFKFQNIPNNYILIFWTAPEGLHSPLTHLVAPQDLPQVVVSA